MAAWIKKTGKFVADAVEIAPRRYRLDREARARRGHVPLPRAAGDGLEPREQFVFLPFPPPPPHPPPPPPPPPHNTRENEALGKAESDGHFKKAVIPGPRA